MSISLASERVQRLNLPSVLNPQAPTMLRVCREYGFTAAVEIVTKLLVQIDVACNGNGNPAKCELWAANILARPDIKGRSLGYLIVALRDGMARTTVYDKRLDLAQLNKLLNDADQRVMDSLPAEEETGEAALNHDWEKLQRDDQRDRSEVKRLSAHVRRLEEKLRNAKDDEGRKAS
jgi:hypothetical protein